MVPIGHLTAADGCDLVRNTGALQEAGGTLLLPISVTWFVTPERFRETVTCGHYNTGLLSGDCYHVVPIGHLVAADTCDLVLNTRARSRDCYLVVLSSTSPVSLV